MNARTIRNKECRHARHSYDGGTDLLGQVLNKKPAQTFVVIEEVATDNWGIAWMIVTKLRHQEQGITGT